MAWKGHQCIVLTGYLMNPGALAVQTGGSAPACHVAGAPPARGTVPGRMPRQENLQRRRLSELCLFDIAELLLGRLFQRDPQAGLLRFLPKPPVLDSAWSPQCGLVMSSPYARSPETHLYISARGKLEGLILQLSSCPCRGAGGELQRHGSPQLFLAQVAAGNLSTQLLRAPAGWGAKPLRMHRR